MVERPAAYLAEHVSEQELLQTVIEMARVHGWLAYHSRPCRTNKGWRTAAQGDVGFPDLVLAKNGRVIFAELKAERGELTARQWTWFWALWSQSAAPEVYIWRPSNLDKIAELLGVRDS